MISRTDHSHALLLVSLYTWFQNKPAGKRGLGIEPHDPSQRQAWLDGLCDKIAESCEREWLL